ncbi:STAS domain-containing protein [Pelobium manganitolerans]|uniref:STAS domain-containing protein n=1 Tax=Pelobium manganitolerans TaxID=1842495 RepID=UPI003FA3B45C
MNYSKEVIGGTVYVTINLSEASLNQSEDFKKFLYDIDEVHPPKIILDLGKIEYMDSSFIGALVGGLKNVLSKGGEMALININSDVMSLFELTRLDKVFKICDNKEDALQQLN